MSELIQRIVIPYLFNLFDSDVIYVLPGIGEYESLRNLTTNIWIIISFWLSSLLRQSTLEGIYDKVLLYIFLSFILFEYFDYFFLLLLVLFFSLLGMWGSYSTPFKLKKKPDQAGCYFFSLSSPLCIELSFRENNKAVVWFYKIICSTLLGGQKLSFRLNVFDIIFLEFCENDELFIAICKKVVHWGSVST